MLLTLFYRCAHAHIIALIHHRNKKNLRATLTTTLKVSLCQSVIWRIPKEQSCPYDGVRGEFYLRYLQKTI